MAMDAGEPGAGTAFTAGGPFTPAPGEAVLWSERSAPPTLVPAGALAVIVGGLGLAAWRLPLTLPLVAVAVLLVVAAWRSERRGWTERYWITDARVVVEERDGVTTGLPVGRIVEVEQRGQGLIFVADDGEELVFAVVQAPSRLAARLPAMLPGVRVARR